MLHPWLGTNKRREAPKGRRPQPFPARLRRGCTKQAQRGFPSGKSDQVSWSKSRRRGIRRRTPHDGSDAFGPAQTVGGLARTPWGGAQGAGSIPPRPTMTPRVVPGRFGDPRSEPASEGQGHDQRGCAKASGDAASQTRRKSQVAGMRTATECGISAPKRHRNHRTRTSFWDNVGRWRGRPIEKGFCLKRRRRVRHQARNGLSLRPSRKGTGTQPDQSPQGRGWLVEIRT